MNAFEDTPSGSMSRINRKESPRVRGLSRFPRAFYQLLESHTVVSAVRSFRASLGRCLCSRRRLRLAGIFLRLGGSKDDLVGDLLVRLTRLLEHFIDLTTNVATLRAFVVVPATDVVNSTLTVRQENRSSLATTAGA